MGGKRPWPKPRNQKTKKPNKTNLTFKEFHNFINSSLCYEVPFSGPVMFLSLQESPLSCYAFVLSADWHPLRKSSVYLWSWSCYFPWWARADWLREPQWRILLLETEIPGLDLIMFSYFLWAFWPCIIDILCHAILINGTTDIFLWQLEINSKSNSPHGQPRVTGSLGNEGLWCLLYKHSANK